MNKNEKNLTGLQLAAKDKRKRTISRVNEAIEKLITQKKAVSIMEVTKLAGVSRSWIFKEKKIADRIRKLQETQPNLKVNPKPVFNGMSQEANMVLVKNLKERIRLLESENKELKKQLEVAYGMVADGL